MIEWNFNMDDAPRDGDVLLWLGDIDDGEAIVAWWDEEDQKFFPSQVSYNQSKITAWARINPPVKP